MNRRSVKKLIEELKSPEFSKRKKAIQLLGEADERAVYPLIKTLSDPHPAIYEAAINSLIKIGGECTAYMMLPLLRMDTRLKNAAMLVLKKIGTWEIIKILLEDKDPYMRMFGLNVISENTPDEACSYIKNLLKDPSANVRAAACISVAKLKCTELIDELLDHLYDVEWVTLSALNALSQLKIPETTKRILPLLESASFSVRLQAIDCLGEINTDISKEALLTHLKKDLTPIEKDFVENSLIKLGASIYIPSIKEKITRLLDSESHNNISLALKAIKDLKATEYTERLLYIAGGLDPEVPDQSALLDNIKSTLLEIRPADELIKILRSKTLPYIAKSFAIELIEKLNIKEAFDDLLPLLKDKSRDIRRAAVRALSKIGGQKGVKEIIALLNDPDGHVRKQAVIALRNIKSPDVYKSVEALLSKEPYSDVMEEAIKTLLAIDKQRFMKYLHDAEFPTKLFVAQYSDSINVVIELSYDADMDIKIAAITRLGKFKAKKAIKRIKEAFYDPSPEIRRVAIMSAYRLNCCKKELEKLLHDDDEWVRYYALKVLKKSASISQKLKKHLLKDSFPPIILESIDMIGINELKQFNEILSRLIKHSDKEIRKKALELIRTR